MKLEKFMFCMTLETIGLVYGYLGAIFGGGVFLLFVSFLLFASMDDNLMNVIAKEPVGAFIAFCNTVFVISAFTHMHVLLIKGIKNKQHKKMIPWLIFNLICIPITVCVLFLGLKFGLVAIFVTCIPVLTFHIYCYMAVSSLFENIRDTSEHGHQLIANVINAGITMPPAQIIAEEKQSQMDFNYMKLV